MDFAMVIIARHDTELNNPWEPLMRRDVFLKSLAAAALLGGASMQARAGANVKMMIPANPGGGWDTTGRELGKALLDAKVADTVQYENKGGAAGALGLAQFVNSAKGDPNSMIITGAVMVGGIITSKSAMGMEKITPIARLTSEYNVFVVPADSPLKTMKDVVEQLKKDPGSVKCRPQEGQLRRFSRRRRGDRCHPGRQCDGGRQRVQRVFRAHQVRQDAPHWRDLGKAFARYRYSYAQRAGL